MICKCGYDKWVTLFMGSEMTTYLYTFFYIMKDVSVKPRDKTKDQGLSPKNFGMNTRTAKLPADEICVQLLGFRKMLG
jgi:hypothetical protein